MMYDSLALSSRYSIEYQELDEHRRWVPAGYDFYAFNYHHVSMAWLDTRSVRRLPGLRLTFVLEVAPNDPFVFCPRPTSTPTAPSTDDRRPRPTGVPVPPPARGSAGRRPLPRARRAVIGTFGFATRGKGFEHVVAAVNKEFDRAIVRLNIRRARTSTTRPTGTTGRTTRTT
jgi:hypothetical protein